MAAAIHADSITNPRNARVTQQRLRRASRNSRCYSRHSIPQRNRTRVLMASCGNMQQHLQTAQRRAPMFLLLQHRLEFQFRLPLAFVSKILRPELKKRDVAFSQTRRLVQTRFRMQTHTESSRLRTRLRLESLQFFYLHCPFRASGPASSSNGRSQLRARHRRAHSRSTDIRSRATPGPSIRVALCQ